MRKLLLIATIALTLVSCGKSQKRDLTVNTDTKYRYICIEQQGYTVNGQFYYYNGYLMHPDYKTVCRYY